MADREKVIAGLECCSRSKLMDRCHECPYFSSCGTEGGSFAEIAHDALALLKACEPRVLSIGEMLRYDGPFLIEYNQSVCSREMCWAIFGILDHNQVYVRCQNLVEHYAITQYGVTWRCWNIRPSRGEMEAIPWNGSK